MIAIKLERKRMGNERVMNNDFEREKKRFAKTKKRRNK